MKILGRGRHFQDTEKVLVAMRQDLALQKPDCMVFTGDACSLGFEDEIKAASQFLGIDRDDFMPGIAVPGNHDVYIRQPTLPGYFEMYFRPWQQGIRVDGQMYPFARKIGPAWFIGVNSSTPNLLPWDARGLVGRDQLNRLEILLSRLDSGPRILVTHYPHSLATGKGERRMRRLRDLDSLVSIANQGGVSLWLHGHRHNHYLLPPGEGRNFLTLCAGSGTQTGHWSYSKLTIANRDIWVERRIYDPVSGAFQSQGIHSHNLPACD